MLHLSARLLLWSLEECNPDASNNRATYQVTASKGRASASSPPAASAASYFAARATSAPLTAYCMSCNSDTFRVSETRAAQIEKVSLIYLESRVDRPAGEHRPLRDGDGVGHRLRLVRRRDVQLRLVRLVDILHSVAHRETAG